MHANALFSQSTRYCLARLVTHALGRKRFYGRKSKKRQRPNGHRTNMLTVFALVLVRECSDEWRNEFHAGLCKSDNRLVVQTSDELPKSTRI